MVPFIYNTPTKVIFEEGGEKHLGDLLKENKATKVLIVYGGQSSIKSGLNDRVKNIINDAGLESIELGGVVPNPLLSKVHEGIKLGKEFGADFILALGGGSAIDTAKAIGMGMSTDEEVWDFYEGKRTAEACLPIGSILTIPAAGSEMSVSTVITKDEGLLKRGYSFSGCACKFSILDPKYTLTLPEYQTFSGIVDILMHTMERYFNTSDNLELTDSLAEGLLRTTITYAKILKDNPNDMEARWNVMWAGSLSHNGLMNCGNNRGDWSTHNIEHELSALYSVAHGAGLSSVWGSWAKYVVDVIPERFEKFAVNVMNIEKTENQMNNCINGIEKMEDFFREISMPTTLKELGVTPTEDEFKLLAEKATFFGKRTVGTVKKLNATDVENILRNAQN